MKFFTCIFFLVTFFSGQDSFGQSSHSKKPNIIIVFIDDMGYGDVGFNNPAVSYPPNFDFIANHGIVLKHFYVSEAVCTASRSSLLTGCYANRVGMGGAIDHKSLIGLNPAETTIAEMLKESGYKTAAYGKWHLGFQKQFLPTSQGFDEFFGIPYSGDMWPNHPENPSYYPPLPLYQNETIIDTVKEQSWFTQKFTEKTVGFIEKNAGNPFFIYLAHPLPHVPLFVSEKFKGATGKGTYADVIHEIDWSIGEIRKSLEKNGLEENTLFIVTSDNGPWLAYGDHAGVTAGLREGKGTSWEGGVRTPFVAYWKNKIPKGITSSEAVMSIDILPTLAAISASSLPAKKIDGVNIAALLTGKRKALPERPLFFYYNRNDLEAMHWRKWKLYFPHSYRTMSGQAPGGNGTPGKYKTIKMDKMELYNLESDPFETKDIFTSQQKVITKMNKMAEAMRKELGDDLTNRKGEANREAGKVQ